MPLLLLLAMLALPTAAREPAVITAGDDDAWIAQESLEEDIWMTSAEENEPTQLEDPAMETSDEDDRINSEMFRALLAPPEEPLPGRRIYPPAVNYAYPRQSQWAYDLIGGQEPVDIHDRPEYPYHAKEYWYGHDADVESWGDLLEAPYVQLGWFATADVAVYKANVAAQFSSGTFLDGVFPGDPVVLGAANLNTSVMPHVEVGYRFEHGLGDVRLGLRGFEANGRDPLAGFDSAGNGVLSTRMTGAILDVDLSILEFNAEGIPFIPPLMKDFGRTGLGKPLANQWLLPPLEIRWIFGARVVSLDYESVGSGDLRYEQVVNKFRGGGLHFSLELNQRLATQAPLFLHARAEGSGIFGYLDQSFARSVTQPVPAASAFSFTGDSLGVPSANLELGVSWVPKWPLRDLRWTASYQFEEWFSWAQTSDSNAELLMHGFLLRCESKF